MPPEFLSICNSAIWQHNDPRVSTATPRTIILHHRIRGMGPPSSGAITTGKILMLLDRFELDELTLDGPRLWHLFASQFHIVLLLFAVLSVLSEIGIDIGPLLAGARIV